MKSIIAFFSVATILVAAFFVFPSIDPERVETYIEKTMRIVVEEALAAGLDPIIIAAIINYETIGTWSVSERPKKLVCSGKGSKKRCRHKFLSSAVGLCQMIESERVKWGLPRSAKEMAKTSVRDQARACIASVIDNRYLFMRKLKRPASPGETYLVHFAGLGRAIRLVRAKGSLRASKLLPRSYFAANGVLSPVMTVAGVRRWADGVMRRQMELMKDHIPPDGHLWIARASTQK